MLARCSKPSHPSWRYYGGKGVKVCREWRESFIAFREWSEANGYADKLTIDRKDSLGNYEPSNCRWATMLEQENNRTNNIRLLAFGEEKTLSEWARDPRCAVSYGGLWRRLLHGIQVEEALSTASRTASRKLQFTDTPVN